MGAQLRVYKRRIRSVTATKKITKAMDADKVGHESVKVIRPAPAEK